MKVRSLLAAIAFILAVGSAVASEKLLLVTSWTHISDVPNQTEACEPRSDCQETGNDCVILVNVGGNPKFVPGYDNDAPDETSCGTRLGMP